MPCTNCRKKGHNKRTCPQIYKESLNKNSDNNSKETPSRQVLKLNYKINLQTRKIKLLEEESKNLKDLVEQIEVENARLNQEILDKGEYTDSLIKKLNKQIKMIYDVRLKFKASMVIFEECGIKKSSAAEPDELPFECTVCFEEKTNGIQCSNKHKLCIQCASKHLWHSNQTCPCCRKVYHDKSQYELTKLSGMDLTEDGLSMFPITPISINNLV